MTRTCDIDTRHRNDTAGQVIINKEQLHIPLYSTMLLSSRFWKVRRCQLIFYNSISDRNVDCRKWSTQKNHEMVAHGQHFHCSSAAQPARTCLSTDRSRIAKQTNSICTVYYLQSFRYCPTIITISIILCFWSYFFEWNGGFFSVFFLTILGWTFYMASVAYKNS